MSARMRLALAIIGLLIILLALAGLVYLLWPLENTWYRFTVPVEQMVLPFWGRLILLGG